MWNAYPLMIDFEESFFHLFVPPPDSDLFALPKYSDYICPPSKPRRINYEFRKYD